MTEQFSIETPAGSFDAIAAGPPDGRPVLLLHGFPEASLAWEHQVGALGGAGFRAVAPDQRGYSPGVRPEQASEYSIDELVGDVLAMAGHSAGTGSTWSGTTGVRRSRGGPPTPTRSGCAR